MNQDRGLAVDTDLPRRAEVGQDKKDDPAPAAGRGFDATAETTPLRAVAPVRTLSPSPKPSSSQLPAEQTMAALADRGDAWPVIRATTLGCDSPGLSTPIRLGRPSSVAQRVLERPDPELGESDDEGRMPTYGTAATVSVVGNEEGARHVSAGLFQGLNDVGFSPAPDAVTYWVGEAMRSTDYQDLHQTPGKTAATTKNPRCDHRAPRATPQARRIPALATDRSSYITGEIVNATGGTPLP